MRELPKNSFDFSKMYLMLEEFVYSINSIRHPSGVFVKRFLSSDDWEKKSM